MSCFFGILFTEALKLMRMLALVLPVAVVADDLLDLTEEQPPCEIVSKVFCIS